MTKVTYRPTDGGNEVTQAFGQFFEAGKAVNVTDERVLEKLKGNPEFDVAGDKSDDESFSKAKAETDKQVAKALDGRSKEAREARQKAQEADADAEAKERAAAQVEAIQQARLEGEKDKLGA